jgi:hypothetical protein
VVVVSLDHRVDSVAARAHRVGYPWNAGWMGPAIPGPDPRDNARGAKTGARLRPVAGDDTGRGTMEPLRAPSEREARTRVQRPIPHGSRRQALMILARTLVTAVGLVLAYYLAPMDRPFTAGTAFGLACCLIGVAVLLIWQTLRTRRSPQPRLRALEGLAATVTPFLLLFSTAYYLMERAEAASFTETMSRTDALYFTVTVFSTVGFGDITAKAESARVLTIVQMLADLVFLGAAIKLLLGAAQQALHDLTGAGNHSARQPQ